MGAARLVLHARSHYPTPDLDAATWRLGIGGLVARPVRGEHAIRSRAFDVEGNVQPAPDDPFLASKVTFWESDGRIARRVRIPSS
jgi:hypothetical protein